MRSLGKLIKEAALSSPLANPESSVGAQLSPCTLICSTDVPLSADNICTESVIMTASHDFLKLLLRRDLFPFLIAKNSINRQVIPNRAHHAPYILRMLFKD